MPTYAAIQEAAQRIRDGVIETPCTRTRAFRDLAPGNHYLKLESLQRTGSFKDRGALNRMLRLTEAERARGVVTASAGNHAQAVAYHGGRLGISVTVVMPETAPLIKVTNTRGYGADVIQVGTILDDAAAEVQRLAAEEELSIIHAFDDEDVIAGQGTMGLEILEQVPDVSVVVMPVGGGGMISGIACAIKEIKPDVRIIGVEADAAASAKASRDAGEVVKIAASDTLADGIATKRIGEITYPLIERYVDELVSVGEEEIAAAILLLIEREKTVAEGAGAVGLAALMTGSVTLSETDRAVLLLSGGNIDINMISRIIDRGLVFDGRLVRLAITVKDRPGSLAGLTRAVVDMGANVLETYHRRAFADISVGDVGIVIQMETRGREHVIEIVHRLEDLGHEVREEQ